MNNHLSDTEIAMYADGCLDLNEGITQHLSTCHNCSSELAIIDELHKEGLMDIQPTVPLQECPALALLKQYMMEELESHQSEQILEHMLVCRNCSFQAAWLETELNRKTIQKNHGSAVLNVEETILEIVATTSNPSLYHPLQLRTSGTATNAGFQLTDHFTISGQKDPFQFRLSLCQREAFKADLFLEIHPSRIALICRLLAADGKLLCRRPIAGQRISFATGLGCGSYDCEVLTSDNVVVFTYSLVLAECTGNEAKTMTVRFAEENEFAMATEALNIARRKSGDKEEVAEMNAILRAYLFKHYESLGKGKFATITRSKRSASRKEYQLQSIDLLEMERTNFPNNPTIQQCLEFIVRNRPESPFVLEKQRVHHAIAKQLATILGI